MSVGERIDELRRKRGLSQNKLAKLAQVSQSGLSSIISGAVSPKENTMNAIASALGCSVYDLLNDTENTEVLDDDPYILRDRLRRDPNYRMLFDAAEKAKPEHIRAAAAMLKSLEGENND